MVTASLNNDAQFDPASPERWDAGVELPAPRSNMPVTLSHRFEAALMHVVMAGARLVSVDRSSKTIGGILRRIGPMFKSVQKRGMRNLELIFPENSEEQNKEILSQVWENLGRTVGEYPHLTEIVNGVETPRIEIENPKLLQEIATSEGPKIFVASHVANWELMSPTLFKAGVKMALIYRAANNPIVDEKIIELRSEVTSRYLIPKSKRGSRAILRAVNDGMSLCLLADQKLNDGIEAPFMGHPAMTAPLAAKMAVKSNLPIVPVNLVRKPEQVKFVFSVKEPITFEPSGDVEADTKELTTRVNKELGDMIMQNPEQWLWFHRRWPKEAWRDAGII